MRYGREPTKERDRRHYAQFQLTAEMRADKEAIMVLASLREFLDGHKTKYVVISHSPAYTAQGIAGLAHISGKVMAKTVIVKLDGSLVMAVIPANFHVDLERLRKAANAKTVALASEEEFKDRFPECETGAMPPFGNLYGLAVFADDSLEKDMEIAFNAGTHRELIQMSWTDFKTLVKPKLTQFAAGRSTETHAA
jgi:Ala-tRNA(Pro) deacylase